MVEKNSHLGFFIEPKQDLVGRLTLNELIDQMAHGGASSNGPAPAINRLGIKPYQWGTECLSGDVSAGDATSFPMAIGMAATFDYDMVFNVTKATSDEVRAKNNDAVSRNNYNFHTGLSCWSPVLNIFRDPRWGRNQETFGEDPWLSGYLGKSFVTALQGDHPRYIEVNAGCKHFDVHGGPENIPVPRFSFDAKVSERDWRMTFLPQFKACVDAGSWSLMCSYNSINGVPACANKKLLTDILRNEWGFKGYVVSDQGALENIMVAHHYTNDLPSTAAVAANAGTCLEDGNSHDNNVFDNLDEAITNNLLTKDVLKDAVSRLFMVRMKLGEFDPPDMNPYTKLSLSIIQSQEHRELSLQAAMKSFVLLKNDDNALPMDEVDKMVGPFVDSVDGLFGDYSPTIMQQYVTTPSQGISKFTKIGKNTFNVESGCDYQCSQYDSSAIKKACDSVDAVIVTAGTSRSLESEGNDRADINLPGQQLQLMQTAAAASPNAPVHLILFNAGPLDISWAKTNPQVKSILEVFFPAQTAGQAIANVLTGKYNPAGRLPNTWPANLDQVPPIVDYTMVNRTYRYFTREPLYPFGYGLSYTNFQYSGLSISPTSIAAGDKVVVDVFVSNVGSRDGEEVTQVYISWLNATGVAPVRQLVGVSRNVITKGNKIKVTFEITGEQMQVWTTEWVIPSGEMKVSVGGQQPNQKTRVPSNILEGNFSIK